MTAEFVALCALSARIGNDLMLVQAAGGNTSLKQDDVMWIKASGTWLMDALRKDIFVPLDFAALSRALSEDSSECESCMSFVRQDLNAMGLRPSIETSVHGLMTQKVVIHVHCVNTLALAICEDARHRFTQLLSTFNWSFIPYARPGLQLARAIRYHLQPGSNVMVLQNHGLAVAADTVAEAETLLNKVVTVLRCSARDVGSPDFNALEAASVGTGYAAAKDAMAHVPALDATALHFGCTQVYYPDHVVFLGATIPTDVASGAPAVAVPGKGVLVHKDAKPAIEPMLRCLSEVFLRLPMDAKLKALTTAEIEQLLDWDAEKYRQTLKIA